VRWRPREHGSVAASFAVVAGVLTFTHRPGRCAEAEDCPGGAQGTESLMTVA
jgi:hypothetical protein